MKLDGLHEAVRAADEVRSLTEGSSNVLRVALSDLASCLKGSIKWALMGGLAVGFRARPRGTQDIDVYLIGESDIDQIVALTRGKFKRHRPHALQHLSSGVEVELLTPEFLGHDPSLVSKVISTATVEDLGGVEVPVVSRGGLVAAKLNRLSRQDAADIEAIVKAGGPVDLSEYPIDQKKLAAYKQIEADAVGSKPLE